MLTTLNRARTRGALTACFLLTLTTIVASTGLFKPAGPAATAAGTTAPLEAFQAAATDEQQKTGEQRFGLSEPLPKARGAVRLATYNVENLFDHNDDPTLEGEFDDIDMATTDERCQALADAIREVDADILALQEIESHQALLWFRDKYLKGMGYRYSASIDVGYYRGIENAVLSRFQIDSARPLPDIPLHRLDREGPGWSEIPADVSEIRFQRRPLCVDVKVNPRYTLTLIVVHHKAGRNRFHREHEALGILECLDELQSKDPSRNIAILGDFNAAPWDKSLRAYLAEGMIDTLAHRIIPRWSDADQTEAVRTKTHSSDRVLDYILLNSAAHRELVVGSAHVYGTLTPPESWDWQTDPHPPGYASDHYPVIVDLMPKDRM